MVSTGVEQPASQPVQGVCLNSIYTADILFILLLKTSSLCQPGLHPPSPGSLVTPGGADGMENQNGKVQGLLWLQQGQHGC